MSSGVYVHFTTSPLRVFSVYDWNLSFGLRSVNYKELIYDYIQLLIVSLWMEQVPGVSTYRVPTESS